MERGQVLARDLAGGDLVEQRPAKAGREVRISSNAGPLRRVERPVTLAPASPPIAGSSKSASPRTATAFEKRTRTSRSQTARRSGGRLSISGLERGLSDVQGCRVIQRQAPDFLERPAVAEESRSARGPDRAGAGRPPWRAFARSRSQAAGLVALRQPVRASPRARRPPAPETPRAGSRRRRAERPVDRGGSRCPRQAVARSAGARSGADNPSPVGTSESGSAVGDRDQAGPDQGRDIVVGAVLGARDEGLAPARRAG